MAAYGILPVREFSIRVQKPVIEVLYYSNIIFKNKRKTIKKEKKLITQPPLAKMQGWHIPFTFNLNLKLRLCHLSWPCIFKAGRIMGKWLNLGFFLVFEINITILLYNNCGRERASGALKRSGRASLAVGCQKALSP